MGLKNTTSCLGFQQITDLSTAKALNVPTGATAVLLQADAQSVRWRDDGVDPTASIGMLIPPSSFVLVSFLYEGDLSKIRFIEASSGGILNVSYYA